MVNYYVYKKPNKKKHGTARFVVGPVTYEEAKRKATTKLHVILSGPQMNDLVRRGAAD